MKYNELLRLQCEAMTPTGWEAFVLDSAQTRGWSAVHSRAVYTKGKWSTPIAGDKGFPDVTVARAGIVGFIECKTGKARRTPEQTHWANQIRPADHITATHFYYLAHPSEVHELLELLK